MSDQETSYQPPRATLYVARKISDQNYGSYEFGIHYPVDFNLDLPVSEQDQLVLDAFEKAKSLLGAQTEAVLATIVEKSFAAPVASAPRAVSTNGAQSAKVSQLCTTCGVITDQYDNRAKIASGEYKPNAPKFKCSVCKKGQWDTPKPVATVGADEPF